MQRIIFCLALAALVFSGAALPDEPKPEELEEYFRTECMNNKRSNQTIEKLLATFREMDKCTGDDILKPMKENSKTKADWEAYFTKLCSLLDAQKKCIESFNMLYIECQAPSQFLFVATAGNASIDLGKNICQKKKDSVVDFVSNNGALCFDESYDQIADCIGTKRLKVGNTISKEEAASLTEKCFILTPCSKQKIKELEEKNRKSKK